MRKVVSLSLSVFLLVGCGREVFYQSPPETPLNTDPVTSSNMDSGTIKNQAEPVEEKSWDSKQSWNGTWSRSGHMDEAVLIIEAEDGSHFDFSLSAFSGGNMGEISGKATFLEDGMTAKYIPKGEHECVVTMLKFEQELDIDVSDGCAQFGGNGVALSGVFTYGELVEEETTLSSLGLVAEDVDNTIRSVLGEDYKFLIERVHLVGEGEDLDGLNATVLHGGVRGLYTIMESIIMYDSDGKVWVALLLDGSIEYYTNVPQFKHSLPQTILKWSERFDGQTINMN